VTIPPGDETAAGNAGRGHLRASHADREQVIGTLKAAFVQGMLGKDEFDLRVGQALAARTYADLAALTADIPPGPAVARPTHPPGPAAGRWPGPPPGRAFAWASWPLPYGSAASPIRATPPAPSQGSGLPCAFSQPFSPYSQRWASLDSGWPPHWSSGAPADSCRPGRGRAATPSTANKAAAPAMARFPPAPATARPALTCALTSHHSAFPPVRPGQRAASGLRQARCDAGETGTGNGASRLSGLGLTSYPAPDSCDRAREQAA
jgi:hypothetical protein